MASGRRSRPQLLLRHASIALVPLPSFSPARVAERLVYESQLALKLDAPCESHYHQARRTLQWSHPGLVPAAPPVDSWRCVLVRYQAKGPADLFSFRSYCWFVSVRTRSAPENRQATSLVMPVMHEGPGSQMPLLVTWYWSGCRSRSSRCD